MRRIVTGLDEAGEGVVVIEDEPAPALETDWAKAWELWVADATPPDLRSRDDAAQRPWELEPPAPSGSLFRLIEWHPGASSGMHSTATLDYVVILRGEITLTTGGKEYLLGPGDVVVQRGAPHDWSNRGSESCFAAAAIISAPGPA